MPYTWWRGGGGSRTLAHVTTPIKLGRLPSVFEDNFPGLIMELWKLK